MKSLFPILCALALLATGLIATQLIPPLEGTTQSEGPKTKRHHTELASGFEIRIPSIPNHALLHLGNSYIEKKTTHGFSFGGINVLVLEQLNLTFPFSTQKTETTKAPTGSKTKHTSRPPSQKLDIEAIKQQLSAGHRCSAMRIETLIVKGLYAPDDDSFELFTAARAESTFQRKLQLHNCRIRLADGQWLEADKATLSLNDSPRLHIGKRTIDLNNLMKAYKAKGTS